MQADNDKNSKTYKTGDRAARVDRKDIYSGKDKIIPSL